MKWRLIQWWREKDWPESWHFSFLFEKREHRIPNYQNAISKLFFNLRLAIQKLPFFWNDLNKRDNQFSTESNTSRKDEKKEGKEGSWNAEGVCFRNALKRTRKNLRKTDVVKFDEGIDNSLIISFLHCKKWTENCLRMMSWIDSGRGLSVLDRNRIEFFHRILNHGMEMDIEESISIMPLIAVSIRMDDW